MDELTRNRAFMRCPDITALENAETDQKKGLPYPLLDKAAAGETIELPDFAAVIRHDSYADLLDLRRSERNFRDEPASPEQLAFILWSSQGVQELRGENRYASFRPVPSGGARHPFEVYIAALRIEGLKQGIYHYLPFQHVGEKRSAVELIKPLDEAGPLVGKMLGGQKWAVKASFVLLFTCIPYRAEWRYHDAAHRVMLIDLGHAGQNVMLSAAALGLGSCCLAAYDADECDKALGVDGIGEYTVYAIPVGVIRGKGEI